jgi:hypothetical protein
MKQIKLLLLLMTTLSMLITGCANPSLPDKNLPTSTDADVSGITDSELPDSDVSEPEELIVRVDYATDELINKYDAVEEFEEAGFQKIIFTTNRAVKNFRFIEISYQEEDGNIKFIENKVLYSIDELLQERPFVVTWMEQGAIPHRGVAFDDESGTTRHFYLSMSGEDGSLLLVEFP